MTDIDYQAISKQYAAMGFKYPSASDFTEGEINGRIARLTPEQRDTTEAAQLKGKRQTTRTMRAFAELADALGGEVTTEYAGYAVIRPRTEAELREQALSLLRSERDAELRALAEQALRDGAGPGRGSGLEDGPLAVTQ